MVQLPTRFYLQHGKRSLIVQLPSLLIIVVGSIGTGIIACRFDPSQYRTVFICGYLSLHWIGTFIWRALSYGFGVIAVEQDPKPSQPPKSSLNPANFLKKLAMHVVMTTITMCMVVIGLIGVSACVQVARNLWR
ncbi:hypothetical protein BC829DRAFT_87149 [Chytridium lagenaria]|nr:hypothetical protein BC829DRAFT_87149 [Chytridium lagenaria]